nr:element excision factor XisH family protein [Okeania sp. SIO3I5]
MGSISVISYQLSVSLALSIGIEILKLIFFHSLERRSFKTCFLVKIAVELKSFAGLSPMNDLENAVGQYIVYHDVLEKTNPERILYLAVGVKPYNGIFSEPIGELMLENQRLNLVVFNKSEEVIIEWIPSVNINK